MQNTLNIALFFEKLAHCMSEEGRKVQGLTRKLKVITTIGQEPWGILVEQFVMTLIGLWDIKAINFSKDSYCSSCTLLIWYICTEDRVSMKTKELIKYFYGDLISQPWVKFSNLLMKSVNFAVQVMKSYYVLVYWLEIQENMKLSYTRNPYSFYLSLFSF